MRKEAVHVKSVCISLYSRIRTSKCIWILFSHKNVKHDLSNVGFRTFV